MFGWCVSTFGLLWRDDTNLSQTASLMRSVTKFRLVSGQRRALTFTLMVCEGVNQSGQGKVIGRAVHIVFRAIGRLSDFPEDAAGNVTLEIDPIHRGPGSLEGDPAIRLRGHRHAKVVEFLFENSLQPARTGCKEP